MILYLDSSAIVKRYVSEKGTEEITRAIDKARLVGTVVVARVEVAAALAKAVRVGTLAEREAGAALRLFGVDWPDYLRTPVTETLVALAESLAWTQQLRAYDAIHLAAASAWQDSLGQPVTLATYDHALWTAARRVGLHPYPSGLT